MSLPTETMDQLARALQSLGLTPAQMQDALRNPASMLALANRIGASAPSSNPDPTDLKEIQKEIATVRANWEKERGLPPVKPLLSLREDLIMRSQRLREQISQSENGSSTHVHARLIKTFVGHEKSFSSTPIHLLQRVQLRDMLARKVHSGRYLLCRTIVQPVRLSCIDLTVEDPNGDTSLLSLYNFPGLFQASLTVVDSTFPVGQVLAIREPWMKMSSAGVSSAFVRVDSPSDVLLVGPSDPLLDGVTWKTNPKIVRNPTNPAEHFKTIGIQYFKKHLYLQAALAWSQGLKEDPEFLVLRLNRSQAYIHLGWFSAALRDAMTVLASAALPIDLMSKATYRMAAAQYGLGRYQDALEQFASINERVWEDRCRCRIKEADRGEYNWVDMFNSGQNPVPRVDVAEFVGAVQVAQFHNRGGGRGVRATGPIKVGDLLVVAKPLASVFPPEMAKQEQIVGLNFLTNRNDVGSRVALTFRVIAQIHGCPESSGLVYDLYGGPNFPLPPSYPPVSDNAKLLSHPLLHEVDIDVSRVEGIISHNAFQPNNIGKLEEQVTRSGRNNRSNDSSALYAIPSMFNHSCHPNATWMCFGDVMVIRAREAIEEGTEITLGYNNASSYREREEHIQSFLHGKCDCVMCEWDRRDGEEALLQRELLLKDNEDKEADSSSPGGLYVPEAWSSIQTFIRKVTSTYSASRGPIRPALFNAQLQAMVFLGRKASLTGRADQFRNAVSHGFAALEAAGFTRIDKTVQGGPTKSVRILPLSKDSLATPCINPDRCVLLMMRLSIYFIAMKDSIMAERWYRAGWWAHGSTYGGGRELFDLRMGVVHANLPFPEKFISMEYGWD